MKQKLFTIGAIAVIAIVGLFVFEHATSAQRPDRNAQGGNQGRAGGGRGGQMNMMNMVSIVDNSWVDLTFSVKVDDATLVKARPIYQASRDKFAAKMKELQASGDMRSAMTEMQSYAATVGKEFQIALKEVLTTEQMTKLNELTKARQAEQANRMNRWRGEGGRRGGGGGGRQ
ncbi:MAG: hypothetical protein OXN25_03770 [Candidatus Poribacteria bacterium]|nr:hypothetical protein [Candidatus Poribacteria bacterium]